MSKAWIRGKRMEFARDVMRDFCQVSKNLERLFKVYDESNTIGFGPLRDLVGEEMNKGLLWRLKDTSHHLFRGQRECTLIGKHLDWALGYIFHESMKLKEDAYQQENYAPWFRELEKSDLPDQERYFSNELMQVLLQTRESIEREIARIRFIIRQCLGMLPVYLAKFDDSILLARFLFKQNNLVREVFGEYYPMLMKTLYNDRPEKMYILAAKSLRLGGWLADASRALEEAEGLAPDSERVFLERKKIKACQ